jgi:hypothetical protein
MAAKIKDGLFIGDAETSQSEVFINDNKISNLINLSGREVQNIWSSHGLVYLTYYWEDRLDYKLFVNHEDTMLMDLVEFIDVSINHGISVLLFSRRGTGRCVVAACLYLMMKYRWGFEKTYDYVYSKKPDIDLNKGFIQQMFALDMKLLAARQKAFSLSQGVDTGFKIEANMTISDIAAMLPPREAKRWNAWDTDYLFDDSRADGDEDDRYGGDSKLIGGEHKHNKQRTGKYSKNPGSQTKEDVEEELVLIYSFVNSKNTINSLPGPYRTAYEVPKHFKLRFDNVRLCQEEDVHMFPTSPPSNARYASAPRGILKGGRHHSDKVSEKSAQPKPLGKHYSDGQRSAKESRSMGPVVLPNHSSSSNSLLDSIAPMHVINSARQQHGSAHQEVSPACATEDLRSSSRQQALSSSGSWTSATDTVSGDAKASSSVKQRSNDLYGFVGMTASESGGCQTRAEAKHDGYLQPSDSGGGRVGGGTVGTLPAALSAEDRLRNLMADMQRQNYGVSSAGTQSAVVGTAVGGKNSRGEHIVRESTIASMDFSASNPLRHQQQPATPSLYELANMHFGDNNGASQQRAAKSNLNLSGRSASDVNGAVRAGSRDYGQYLTAPLREEGEDPSDPLSAFGVPHTSTAVGRNGGAVRARHDIVSGPQASTSTYLNSGRGTVTYPPPPRVQQPAKTAWSDSPSTQQTAQTARGVSPSSRGPSVSATSTSGRHPSPSLRQQQQGSSLSVTSINSGVSSVHQQGNPQQQTAVGSGSSSGSRVYRWVFLIQKRFFLHVFIFRHGSPAPNAVRSSRSTAPATSSSGYGGGSVGSVGTVGSGGAPGGASSGGYGRTNQGSGAPIPARFELSVWSIIALLMYFLTPRYSSSSNRPASPSMSARAAAPNASSSRGDQQSGTPQRRLSSNSVHTANSDLVSSSSQQPSSGGQLSSQQQQQPDRRRSGSPMLVRTSLNGGNGAGVSGAGGVSGKRFSTPTPQSSQHHDYDAVSGARGVRSSTPTKSSWKF